MRPLEHPEEAVRVTWIDTRATFLVGKELLTGPRASDGVNPWSLLTSKLDSIAYEVLQQNDHLGSIRRCVR